MNAQQILDKISELVGEKVRLVRTHDVRSFADKSQSGYYRLTTLPEPKIYKTIASFVLVPMPGCCGVVVSTGAHVSFECRNMGIGTLMNQLRIILAKELGYSQIYCTVTSTNTHQIKILQKNGWWFVGPEFTNSKTGNKIRNYIYHI